MSDDADPNTSPEREAAARLAQVQAKVESAQALLARLLQELVVAESRLGKSEAAQMLEANEQLVLSAVRHQSDAAIAAKVLAKVSRSAELDALTQLPNRVLMLDRCAQAIATAKRHDRRLALLFMDLNGFKHINDTLGHASGDEVLKLVAHRLVATVRDTDTVSRHGGDEFVVLLTEVTQPADAGRIASALLLALAEPSRIGDQVVRLTASIGIAMYPEDGGDVQTLLQRADAAMYQAKRHGLGRPAFCDPKMDRPFGEPRALTAQALRAPIASHASAVDDQQRRYAELREANETLVLAALSAQELRAAAERAFRHQAEFMSLIAKELGDPLTPIRLAAAMLGQVHSAEPLLPRAQAIIAEHVETMARLVSAVKEVSEAGASRFRLEPQVVDLVAVIDAAAAACRPALDARLQTFTIQLPDCRVHVLGEAARLEQAVRNLLDNASQYTPDLGLIALVLSIRGERAELTVSDTGLGISAIELPNIFEPFAQDTPAVGFRAVGLGIGLTVVRAVVEAHGGTVVARSAGTGRGSQFTMTLPLAAGPATSVATGLATPGHVPGGQA